MSILPQSPAVWFFDMTSDDVGAELVLDNSGLNGTCVTKFGVADEIGWLSLSELIFEAKVLSL